MTLKQGYWPLVIGALFCVTPTAVAQCVNPPSGTSCMDLTSAGSNVMGGVYVGPYFANINNGPTTAVICDDFYDDTYVPEIWNAYSINGSQAANSGSTRMDGQFTTNNVGSTAPACYSIGDTCSKAPLTVNQAYDVVGYLANEMLSTPTTTPQYNQAIGEIDFALWSVFDPTGALSYGTSATCGGCNQMTTTQESQALSYLSQAVNWVENPANSSPNQFISEFTVYYTNSSPQSPSGVKPPQEFLVYTPEPTTIALMAVDLSGIAGLLFFLRRRPRQPRA